MGLKVIGAGGPRTGTASLKSALETLGFGECSHMEGLFARPDLVDLWVQFFETGTTDFDKLFDGFQSTADFPGYLHYKALLEKYPDAKVVLTLRDPEEWYESMSQTVHSTVQKSAWERLKIMRKMLFSARFRVIAKAIRLVKVYLMKKHYKGEFKDKQKTIGRYLAFNEEVRRHVPPGQLLEMHISEGWEPLCMFLGVPIPDEVFPVRNQRKQFQEQIGKMMNSGGQLEIK